MRRRARLNAGLLLGVAVGFFGWSLVFAQWEVRLLALVPLGLAFVDKLVARVPMLKDDVTALFTHLLAHRATTATLVALLLGMAVASQFVGAVEVVSAEPPAAAGRRVELRSPGKEPEVTTLGGQESVRWPVATRWWDARPVSVWTPGQQVTLEVLPWHRREIRLADTFGAPVLLLRPSPQVMDLTLRGRDPEEGGSQDVRVEIRSGGATRKADYAGRSLLLGCPADHLCLAPAAEDRRVDDVLANRTDARYRRRWLQPQRLEGVALEPGGTLEVEIRVEGQELATWSFRLADGPALQVEDLDATW